MANAVKPDGRRLLGVVSRVDTRDRGYIFITGEDGEKYFAHQSAFVVTSWFGDVAQGDGVSFRQAVTGKGYRAFQIEPARGEEVVRIAAMEEDRGNR